MGKIKLTVDTTDMEMTQLRDSDVHYRIITDRVTGEATSACVQNFDYYGYGDRFVTDLCFINEKDADDVAKKMNKVGLKHFV